MTRCRDTRHLVIPVITLILSVFIPLQVYAATRAEVYRQAKSGTVLIVAIDHKTNSIAVGSGFLVNSEGLLVTNAHVLEDSSRILVYMRDQEIYDHAQIIAVDTDQDLAALQIPLSGSASLALASESVSEGAEVMAVGYPRLTDVLNMGFALHHTIVPASINGIVQGRSRIKQKFAPFIQMTGHINQGSSGGPLVDLSTGEVAGMVALQVPYLERARDRNGAGIGSVMLRSGIGYAIPASTIRRWLAENGLHAQGRVPAQPSSGSGDLVPSAQRSFATGHLINTIAKTLPKDADLYNLAIYHYEAALAVDPNDAKLVRHLGMAYLTMDRVDDAIRLMRDAVAHHPGSPALVYELGLAQEAKGLRADALNTWQNFLRRSNPAPDPDGWQDKMRTAVVRVKTGPTGTLQSLAGELGNQGP
jgi:S1-C subfamily serine protease